MADIAVLLQMAADPKLDHLVRDVLGDRIALQTLGATLAAVTAVLHAAERRLGNGRDEVVDREVAHLDPFREPFDVAGGAGEGGIQRAVFQLESEQVRERDSSFVRLPVSIRIGSRRASRPRDQESD